VQVVWVDRDGGSVPRGQRFQAAVEEVAGRGSQPVEYAWVGAEAGTVKSLRRALVGSGVNPRTSEFRGYWSIGKAGSGANGIPLTGLQPQAPAGRAQA
jgi:iron complex transport system ATP-binding protein